MLQRRFFPLVQSSHVSPRAIDVSAEAVDAAVGAVDVDRRMGEETRFLSLSRD